MENNAVKITEEIILSNRMIETIAERERKIAINPNPWIDADTVFNNIENKINETV